MTTQGTWTRGAVTAAGLMKVADVRRQLKGKGTMDARQHGNATQQELTACEESASKPLETRPHAREWCPLGSGISVLHGIV